MAQLAIENLIIQLRNTKNPLIAPFFALQRRILECDPATQTEIIREVEHRVYGQAGLDEYEQGAKSEIERLSRRSYAQYLCHEREVDSYGKRVVWRLAMVASVPPLVVYLLFHTFIGRKNKRSTPTDIVVCFKRESLRDVLCGMFRDRAVHAHAMGPIHLGRKEIGYFLRVLRVCPRILLYPKWLVNFLRWLAQYGYVVNYLRPVAVAHYTEWVASSSLITGYLREQGVRHLNVMHGERFFLAQGAYCEFDEHYVWGRHFAELGKRLKERSKFVVKASEIHREIFQQVRRTNQPRPKRLLITHNPIMSADRPDYRTLVFILSLLDETWEVVIRRHPAWSSNFEQYVQALQGEEMVRSRGVKVIQEPPDSISMREALAKSRVVVGGTSTAMLEGNIAGCKIIYLAGLMQPSVLLDRHQGSENAIFASLETSPVVLRRFLSEPASLTADEDEKLDGLTHVLADP